MPKRVTPSWRQLRPFALGALGLATALMLLPGVVVADCNDESSLARAAVLHPDLELRMVLAACAPVAGFSVVALATQPDTPADGGAGQETYDLNVLIFDSGSGLLRSQHNEAQALVRRGFHLQDLDIDSTPLWLAPGVATVVVRAVWTASSGNHLQTEAVVNVYVLEGRTLRRVTQGLRLDALHGQDSGHCDGRSTEQRSRLTLADGHSHGYANLLLERQEQSWGQRMVEQGCAPVAGPTLSRRQRLRFNGHNYVPGPWLPSS